MKRHAAPQMTTCKPQCAARATLLAWGAECWDLPHAAQCQRQPSAPESDTLVEQRRYERPRHLAEAAFAAKRRSRGPEPASGPAKGFGPDPWVRTGNLNAKGRPRMELEQQTKTL